MKKRCFLIVLSIVSLQTVLSQQKLLSSGGDIQNNGTISYSIGQIFYATNTSNTSSISQGIQQSVELFVLSNTQFNTLLLEATTFPNPTKDDVVLSIKNSNLDALSYYLFDVNGRQLTEQKVTDSNSLIQLQSYSSGIYILKVMHNKLPLKIFKIIKN